FAEGGELSLAGNLVCGADCRVDRLSLDEPGRLANVADFSAHDRLDMAPDRTVGSRSPNDGVFRTDRNGVCHAALVHGARSECGPDERHTVGIAYFRSGDSGAVGTGPLGLAEHGVADGGLPGKLGRRANAVAVGIRHDRRTVAGRASNPPFKPDAPRLVAV